MTLIISLSNCERLCYYFKNFECMSQKKNHASFMIGWARVQISARRPAILTDSLVDSFSPSLKIGHHHCSSALFLVLYSVCSYSSKQLSPELLKAFLPGNMECQSFRFQKEPISFHFLCGWLCLLCSCPPFSVFSIVHECGHSAPKFLHSRYYTVYVTVALDTQ